MASLISGVNNVPNLLSCKAFYYVPTNIVLDVDNREIIISIIYSVHPQ